MLAKLCKPTLHIDKSKWDLIWKYKTKTVETGIETLYIGYCGGIIHNAAVLYDLYVYALTQLLIFQMRGF